MFIVEKIQIMLLIFLFCLFFHNVYSDDLISININVTQLPFLSNVSLPPNFFSNCPWLSQYVNQTHVISYPPASTICNVSSLNRAVYIFVFNSTFRPYLFTLNGNGQTMESLQAAAKISLSGTGYTPFVVANTASYTIYFLCQINSNFCLPVQFNTDVYNAMPKTFYSACGGLPNCSTTYDFSTSNVFISTMPYPLLFNNCTSSLCLNGGTCNPVNLGFGRQCMCPNVPPGIGLGPRCETLDISLIQDSYYFNVLGNTANLTISFELFCTSFGGTVPIFTIPATATTPQIQYNQSEGTAILTIGTSPQTSLNISVNLDVSSWLFFRINITPQNFTFTILNQAVSGSVNQNINLNLEAVPFILNAVASLKTTRSVCIKNLKINTNLIDLNPGSTCCYDRCTDCGVNKTCSCAPFKSQNFGTCYCKFGYIEMANNTCIEDNRTANSIQLSSTTSSTQMIMSNTSSLYSLTDVQFQYRTLSFSGNLITVAFLSPPNHSITLRIDNYSYNMTVYSPKFPNGTTAILSTYNASDGDWHIVDISVRSSGVTLSLDLNAFLQSLRIFGWTYVDNTAQFITSSVTIGQMVQNNTLRTTCYASMRLLSASADKVSTVPVGLSNFTNANSSCSNYPDCTTITCAANSNCSAALWQQPQCLCVNNYYMYNGNCINACTNNLCLNNGVCIVNATSNTYSCNCTSTAYAQPYCTAIPTAATYWGIAVAVGMLLLIVLAAILIYLYCAAGILPPKYTVADINKINENAVAYHDQAGEADFVGPPINFDLLNKALKNQILPPTAKVIPPSMDLTANKNSLEKGNIDLVLDHPLEYGYEGNESDRESVSSLGSGSINSNLNTDTLDKGGNNFDYLKSLYK